jgi:glucose/arabinose dehydrogenase
MFGAAGAEIFNGEEWPKMRGQSLRRALTALGVATLAAGVVQAVPAGAAPTRYEAENAVCQGTIDSDHTGFSGTGFCNPTNAAGNFVEFTVTAASAGTAAVVLRFANGTTADRPMDIAVNGSMAAAGTSFMSTGTWDTWQSKTLTLPLNAGSNTIRATATTATGGPNVDFLEVDTATAPATDLQAENATISQGVVESNHLGFTGTGFVNYDNVTGSFVEFANVSSAAAGPASLTFRFANGTTTDRPMSVTVNGAVLVATQSFPGTGNWDTWQEITLNATLRAGNNTVRATATTANGGPNLDRLRVGAPADTEHPTAPGQPSCGNISFDSLTLDWPPSTDNVGVTAYDIFNLGQKIAEAPNPPGPPFRVTGLTPNTRYQISVFARDAAGNESDSSPEVVCTTTADPGDPDPPTAPGQPTASNVGQTNATLSWGASTDNRGVTRYDIRVDSNNSVIDSVTGTPPATTKTITVACGQHFVLHVVAKDAAGNTSVKSPTVTFDTAACGGGNNPGNPVQVSGGWAIPWDISFAPDGTFALVTERDTFNVFRINKDGSGKTQVGSVPNSQTTGGEGGLMGVAFSPTWNGTSDQEVFLMHTSSEGNRIAKMNFNGTALSSYTAIVMGIRKSRFHNGGRIRFGPDGFLYATAGDSQQSDLAQDPNSLNGKILRVTKTGAAAPGNPFGTRIYSLGHRNPQGLAWDAQNRLWESELGNSAFDELNLIQAGKNYGWPTCEGNCNVSGMTNPKHTWGVAEASPSGLAFANGALFMAALRGQRLWRIVINGENVTTVSSHFNGTFGRLRAVVKVPGENAIWIGTTNSDNNGNGTADRILRSNLS